MIRHPHQVKNIRSRTINGRPVFSASVVEENGRFQAEITDAYGIIYASGSNSTDISSERRVLREMLDPAVRI